MTCVSTVGQYAPVTAVNVTPFQTVAVTLAAQSYAAPLSGQGIILYLRQHLVKAVTAHQDHAVTAALRNQTARHIKTCTLVEVKPGSGRERQRSAIGHIQTVIDDIRKV